jgi:hypothetical protein
MVSFSFGLQTLHSPNYLEEMATLYSTVKRFGVTGICIGMVCVWYVYVLTEIKLFGSKMCHAI